MGRPTLSDAGRAARRRHLLDTADQLFRERGELPLVADIASAAGLAKGTVYLYFSTKEEIFIALLEDHFQALYGALFDLLPTLPAQGDAAAQAFAAAYCTLIRHDCTLLQLAVLVNTVLERNLPVEPTRRFKSILADGLHRAGALLAHRLPPAQTNAGAALLLQTYGLTIGLWQALDHPSGLAALIALEPGLRVLARDFHGELTQAVERLWRGALTHPAPASISKSENN